MENEIKKVRGFYEIESKQLPAVTTVIEKVLAKSQLRFWFGKVGNSEAARISAEAKSFGSAMHKMIAEYLRSGVEPARDSLASEVKQAWDVWYEWWEKSEHRKVPISPSPTTAPPVIEKIIYNDEYAGTCDYYNGLTLIDWKFGGGIYDGYKVQAGAYAKLLNASNALIVRVAKDEKNIEILEMDKEQLEEAAEIFQALLKVFWWLRGGKK